MLLPRNMNKSEERFNLLRSRNWLENEVKAVHCILLQINLKCTPGERRNEQDTGAD